MIKMFTLSHCVRRFARLARLFVCAASATTALAQRTVADSASAWTAADDHRQMMQQLGIKTLRPGPSGNERDPNHANYEETKANPFTSLPDALILKNGQRVTTRALWSRRRAELIEDFEREVYGRIPKNVPRVTWKVIASDTGTVGSRRVIGRQLIGHVDNSTFPEITVDIPLTLVVPSDAKGRVPVMIMFRPATLPQALGRPAPPGARASPFLAPPAASDDAPATEQLIVDGWGFAFLDATAGWSPQPCSRESFAHDRRIQRRLGGGRHTGRPPYPL